MNEQEILQKMREVFRDCQEHALVMTKHHPSVHKGFVADMQFASTYGSFLGNIKIKHWIDIESDSIAQRLIDALAKTDSHSIGKIREEIYAALDEMKVEQYPSYVFLTCFPSIYKALNEQ